ncbi:hypothetical protein ONA24_06200 [Mycoplasmopsis cynos]|nr:hypothetical protein [Mycoplasmopsis cynos]WAM10411.1 hypothetical protein ONA24_06200 [Mycoplasmopsis cynos]
MTGVRMFITELQQSFQMELVKK